MLNVFKKLLPSVAQPLNDPNKVLGLFCPYCGNRLYSKGRKFVCFSMYSHDRRTWTCGKYKIKISSINKDILEKAKK